MRLPIQAPDLSVAVFAFNTQGDLFLAQSAKPTARGWGAIGEKSKPSDRSLADLAKRAYHEESGAVTPRSALSTIKASEQFGIISALFHNITGDKIIIGVGLRLLKDFPIRPMGSISAVGFFSTKPTTEGNSWDKVVSHPLDRERITTHLAAVAAGESQLVEFEYRAGGKNKKAVPYRKLSQRPLSLGDFDRLHLPLAALGSIFPTLAPALGED